LPNDTLSYDTLDDRPLPQWLIDQKSGLTTIQPEKIVMQEDHSLKISFTVTIVFIILVVAFLTFYINRKNKKQAS
jgi:heme/copper-type cytochrome/quinol oxidase subunit 2